MHWGIKLFDIYTYIIAIIILCYALQNLKGYQCSHNVNKCVNLEKFPLGSYLVNNYSIDTLDYQIKIFVYLRMYQSHSNSTKIKKVNIGTSSFWEEQISIHFELFNLYLFGIFEYYRLSNLTFNNLDITNGKQSEKIKSLKKLTVSRVSMPFF